MKGFVLLILLLRALPSIWTTEFSDQYDITKALNDTIVEIFQTAQPQNISKVIDSVENADPVDLSVTPYKYNVTLDYGYETEIKYYDLRVTNVSSNNTSLSYGFLDNKIELYSLQFIVNLSGKMEVVFNHYYNTYDFNSLMNFTGFTISAIRQSNDSADSFFIDYKYDDAKFDVESPWMELSSRKNIEQTLRLILRTHMNRNTKLLQALSKIHVDQPKKYPHIVNDEHLFYYSIANVSDGFLKSRNIVARGLWNFYSLNFTMQQNNAVTYTLVMKDIRGSMILEDESSNSTSTLELHYFVESVSISVTEKLNQISVKAERYRITETKLNTNLTGIQSDLTMLQVEWVIGTSTMPSMNYINWRSNNRSITFWTKLEMKTCNLHILKDTLKLYNETTATKRARKNNTSSDSNKTTNSIHIKENITSNAYHYYISFPEAYIELLSRNPKYPDQIHCELPHDSIFTRRIVIPPSKINETTPVEVFFHFNYPSINVSLVKTNISKENNPCQFEIGNNQDIKIELPPLTNNTKQSNEHLKVKKKIDATLMSMMKDRIVRIIKPAVCFPFRICKQTAKVLDDFFIGFVNIVMKKCWF